VRAPQKHQENELGAKHERIFKEEGIKPPQWLLGEEGELIGNVSSGMCHHSCLKSSGDSH